MNSQASGHSSPIRSLPSLVLVGGGGHCRSLADVIETTGEFEIAGFVDLPSKKSEKVLGYPWLGRDEDLPLLTTQFAYFLVSAGQLGLPTLRERLFATVQAAGGRLPVIRSPRAHISRHARVGEGTVVFHGAIVNAGAEIGRNGIINSAALVEHDVTIGDHCHISTGVRVNGGCRIKSRSFIGSGAVLKEGIVVEEGTVVGAGSVLLRDTEAFGVYIGVPARRIR
jgi:sugar O-acyltransferase (sialic acid O-acetyltransferase NeuD family)